MVHRDVISPGSTSIYTRVCLTSALECVQEQWKQPGTAQAERALGIRAIPRTLSVGESGRSSATLGTSSVEEWLQQAAGESDNDGDSPASMLRYQLMQGECSSLSHAVPLP